MRLFAKSLQFPTLLAQISLAALLLALATVPARGQAKAADPAAPAAPKPAPDVILFTNGDQLTGTLERGAGNSVVFKSDTAGEITVPLDKVKELHTSGSFAVLRKDVPITSVAAARNITPRPHRLRGRQTDRRTSLRRARGCPHRPDRLSHRPGHLHQGDIRQIQLLLRMDRRPQRRRHHRPLHRLR
jgi:hypothetical protein